MSSPVRLKYPAKSKLYDRPYPITREPNTLA